MITVAVAMHAGFQDLQQLTQLLRSQPGAGFDQLAAQQQRYNQQQQQQQQQIAQQQQQQQQGGGAARAVTTPRQQVTLQPFMGQLQLQMSGGSGQLPGNVPAQQQQQQSPHPQQLLQQQGSAPSSSGAAPALQLPPSSAAQAQQLLQSPGRCAHVPSLPPDTAATCNVLVSC